MSATTTKAATLPTRSELLEQLAGRDRSDEAELAAAKETLVKAMRRLKAHEESLLKPREDVREARAKLASLEGETAAMRERLLMKIRASASAEVQAAIERLHLDVKQALQKLQQSSYSASTDNSKSQERAKELIDAQRAGFDALWLERDILGAVDTIRASLKLPDKGD
jgi:hypothetical protein